MNHISCNRVIKELQLRLENEMLNNSNLEAAIVWTEKFDNISVKDMREFLESLKPPTSTP